MDEPKGLNKPEYEDLNDLLWNNEVRVCSVCGGALDDGYYLEGEYACSDECRRKIISDDDYIRACYHLSDDEPIPSKEEQESMKPFSSDYYYWSQWENYKGWDLDEINKMVAENEPQESIISKLEGAENE